MDVFNLRVTPRNERAFVVNSVVDTEGWLFETSLITAYEK